MSRTLLVLILCLSALRLGASSGSRSILRVVADNAGDAQDYAVDLNATSFDAVLKDTPATFAVVEFFAHWLVPSAWRNSVSSIACLFIRIFSAVYFVMKVDVETLCLLWLIHAS